MLGAFEDRLLCVSGGMSFSPDDQLNDSLLSQLARESDDPIDSVNELARDGERMGSATPITSPWAMNELELWVN
jgi:hypothetical protein